jgi:hypothetical protein
MWIDMTVVVSLAAVQLRRDQIVARPRDLGLFLVLHPLPQGN